MKLNFMLAATAAVAALTAATPSQAFNTITDGHIDITPMKFGTTLNTDTNVFHVQGGNTTEHDSLDDFMPLNDQNGFMNADVHFGGHVGAQVALADNPFFFMMKDTELNRYYFDPASVLTTAYELDNPTHHNGSITLYLLGKMEVFNSDGSPNSTAVPPLQDWTAASMTLTFTRTKDSAWSLSGSFAVPPAATGLVPEPASWALMLGGFGAIGAAMRAGRRKTAVTFA